MYIEHACCSSTAMPTSPPLGIWTGSPCCWARCTAPSKPPPITNSSMASSAASGSLKPWPSNSFMPLYSGGLCEADMTTPPAAFSLRVSRATAGVGTMPAKNAVPPALVMPATRAACSMSPESRVSRPTTMVLPRNRTAAWPRPYAMRLVSSTLAMPRTPSVPNNLAMSSSFLADARKREGLTCPSRCRRAAAWQPPQAARPRSCGC